MHWIIGFKKLLFLLSCLLFIYITCKLFQSTESISPLLETKSEWPATDKVVVIAVTGPPYLIKNYSLQLSKYFHLYLPICVSAWRRIGYSTLIVVVGESDSWLKQGHYLNHVYETIQNNFNNWALFHFVQVQQAQWINYVRVARVIRLFAADLPPIKGKPYLYLATNDADTIPLNDIYSLPSSSYDIRVSVPFRRYFHLIDSDEPLSKLKLTKKIMIKINE